MKKIFLVFMLLAMAAALHQSYGQACAPGAIKRWDGTGGSGDQGLGQAGTGGTNLFIINGTIPDWTEHITGPLNPAYSGVTPPTYQPDPFSTPVSAPNVQFDGLKAGTGSNYDRDRP